MRRRIVLVLAAAVLVPYVATFAPAEATGNPPSVECASERWDGRYWKQQIDDGVLGQVETNTPGAVAIVGWNPPTLSYAAIDGLFRIVLKYARNSDRIENPPLVGSIELPENISHVTFCFESEVPPSSTTTTDPSQTTTTSSEPPSTTVTTGPPGSSTTTEPPPTTSTSITVPPSSTTEPPSSTTTEPPPSSTTTEPPPSSTTTEPPPSSTTTVTPTTVDSTPKGGVATGGGGTAELPVTGLGVASLSKLGAILVAAGLGLLALYRSRSRAV